MNVTILYSLGNAGQKASILSGGDGKSEQSLEVTPDSPDFARALDAAIVSSDGTATLHLRRHYSSYSDPAWDHIPTATEILDEIVSRKAREAADKAADNEKSRLNTQAVVDSRQTTSKGNYNEDAVQLVPAWPYNADDAVKKSPEAIAWKAELDAANIVAVEAYHAKKAAESEAAEAKKVKAAEQEAARRAALGMKIGDIDLQIEDGALTEVPPRCWESHKRGKNWMAVIDVNPASPGGLDRSFAAKAKGESYYILPSLSPGDAVEFGADYYSGSGRKNGQRWYGYVVRIIAETDEEYGSLILHEIAGGKTAAKEGRKFAASLAVASA